MGCFYYWIWRSSYNILCLILQGATGPTGATGPERALPTLDEVLNAGNNAAFQSIDNLTGVTIADGNIRSLIDQSGVILQIGSGNVSSSSSSQITLSVTDIDGVSGTALTIAKTAVTVVALLDVKTSIRYPDNSIQISAPRYYQTDNSSAVVPLEDNMTYNVLTINALPIGSYVVSGFIRNQASVGQVKGIQSSFTITGGGVSYPVGFSALGTQNVNQDVPYFPVNGVFRCTSTGTVFYLTQFVSFSEGIYTKIDAHIDIYYLGSIN